MDSILVRYKDVTQPITISPLTLFVTNSLGNPIISFPKEEDKFIYERVYPDTSAFFCRRMEDRQEVRFWLRNIVGTDLLYSYDDINCTFLQKILTACITTREYYGLIIDHPELYLSPQDCFNLGEFFTFALKRNLKLLIHTNSEQLINSLRSQTYQNNLDTTIYYLNDKLNKIKIDSDGYYNIDGKRCSFPTGFFDVSISALMKLGL
jgi:Uncharacterized conserved protein